MADKKINQLDSGSIAYSSLIMIGDPNTGGLTQTSYQSLKDFVGSGGTTGSFNTGSLTTTASFNLFTASYNTDSSSFDTRIKAISSSITGSYVTTGTFQSYTASVNSFTSSYIIDSASFNKRITNVFSSESNYLPTASFLILSSSILNDSASFNSRINSITGSSSSGSVIVLNFIPGDGQSFSPTTGSTIFSSSILVNRTILQLQEEGFTIAPISRSVSWYSFTSSLGKINMNNSSFLSDVYFQIIYT
jgi:hypothetical protein